jgi:hypothetical protein
MVMKGKYDAASGYSSLKIKLGKNSLSGRTMIYDVEGFPFKGGSLKFRLFSQQSEVFFP